ncbi:MAG: ABC transporter substrate-binding protein [Sulfurimonas sp.]|jgi:signal transduction histidine kinase/ABC-type nitrate/sulfonate/bicarbonate transport system substrate-binding protein
MKFFNILFILFITHLSASALDNITLQLQWKHQFEFAGFYAAQEKGFYKDVGLDVKFVEFNETTNITEEVLNGHAQYGLTYSSIIAEYMSAKPIVLVANFFKQSPLVLVAQKNIHTPNDLKGKKVMGISESIDNSTLLTMLDKFNVSVKDIINIPTSFNIDDFINKKVDAMSIFTTNELYYLEKSGIEYTIFDPVLYGAKYYDVNLFTSKNEVQNHPLRVQMFKEASIKGWKYALEHKDEVIDLILKKYNTQNKSKEALKFEAMQIEKIMLPNVYEIGSIDLDRVKIIADNFVQSGFIENSKNKNLELFIYDYKSKNNSINFTLQEREYLEKKKEITMCADPDWMPFEAIENGEVVGLNKEFIQIAQEKLGVEFKLIPTKTWSDSIEYVKTNKCDILSLVSPTNERKTYLNFTDPHLKVPQVIVTQMDKPTIIDISILEDKTIACVKNYSIIDMIKQKYKNIKIVEVKNVQDGLEMVSEGKVFGFADTSIAIGYYIQNGFFTNLKISASFDEKVSLGFGIRSDDALLYAVLQKVVLSISEEQKQSIMKKWFSIKQEVGFDYSLFLKMIAFFAFFSLFFIYRQYELKKLNNKLQKSFEEERINSRDKDQLIFNQKKLAAMDEVLENIAHQWRQPLSQINSSVLVIDDRMYEKNFKDDVIEEKLLEIESLTQYMSKTINDFKNFFDGQSKMEKYSLKDLIDKSVYIIRGSLLSFNIKVEVMADKKCMHYGFPNELEQVILVILNNAKDVLVSRSIQYPMIRVEVEKIEHDYHIRIEDNGGGIDESIIHKIFDPYFTTKYKSQGTGLGLYISQMIIKERMNAELIVNNTKIGACFTIIFKDENA